MSTGTGVAVGAGAVVDVVRGIGGRGCGLEFDGYGPAGSKEEQENDQCGNKEQGCGSGEGAGHQGPPFGLHRVTVQGGVGLFKSSFGREFQLARGFIAEFGQWYSQGEGERDGGGCGPPFQG